MTIIKSKNIYISNIKYKFFVCQRICHMCHFVHAYNRGTTASLCHSKFLNKKYFDLGLRRSIPKIIMISHWSKIGLNSIWNDTYVRLLHFPSGNICYPVAILRASSSYCQFFVCFKIFKICQFCYISTQF